MRQAPPAKPFPPALVAAMNQHAAALARDASESTPPEASPSRPLPASPAPPVARSPSLFARGTSAIRAAVASPTRSGRPPPPAAGSPSVASATSLLLSSTTSNLTRSASSAAAQLKALAASSTLIGNEEWAPSTTAARSERRPSDGNEEEAGMSVEDLVGVLKPADSEGKEVLIGVGLTSVLLPVGAASSAPSKLHPSKPPHAEEDAAGAPPKRPGVILPMVTIADFAPFFERTRARTERFLGRVAKRTSIEYRGFALPARAASEGEGGKRGPVTPEESAQILAACYAGVPSHFFSPKFDVVSSNPSELLLSVIERAEAARRLRLGGASDAEILAAEQQVASSSEEIQRRLTSWRDLVERALWTQTTTKADTIFQAVSNLHSLQSMVKLESARVVELRSCMRHLREVTTQGRAHVLMLQRERTNAVAAAQILAAVRRVALAKQACDKLLSANDYMGAFEAIESTTASLQGELAGVHALRTVSRQLRDTKEVIGHEMAERFVALAARLPDAVPSTDAERAREEARLQASLTPLVRGLARKGNLKDALSKHRSKLSELIKFTGSAVIKPLIPATGSLSTQEERVAVSAALLEMDSRRFAAFLHTTRHALEPIVQRSESVHAVLTTILPNFLGGEDLPETLRLSAGAVQRVKEHAVGVAQRLVAHRAPKHASYTMEELATLWEACQTFLVKWGGPGGEFRSLLGTQAEDWLARLASKHHEELRVRMEDHELWEAVVVPRKTQYVLERVENGRLAGIEVSEDGRRASLVEVHEGSLLESSSQVETKRLFVHQRAFHVTSSALTTIGFLNEYAKAATLFPSLTYAAASKATDVVVAYNEKCRGLILGGQAMAVGRVNRLPKLGAKHLSLASQSVACLHETLAAFAAYFEPRIPVQQTARLYREETERVLESLQSHVGNVRESLAGLIRKEIRAACGGIATSVDWDDPQGLSADMSPYMTALTGKIQHLHSILAAHMDREELDRIFQLVADICNAAIPEQFAQVQPATPVGKTRVRNDVSQLVATLRKLKGATQVGPGDVLENWLDAKLGKTSAAAAP